MNLEHELRQTLKRQEPSEGFAERVIERAGPAETAFQRAAPKRRWLLWPSASFAAAAAALVLSLTMEYRHRQEEEAGRQAILALRIASQKLNMARDKVINR